MMNDDEIKYYLSFIGWGRSGNSLVGALLHFHPNIYIKNEFYPIQNRFETQEQIFNKIFEKLKRRPNQLWGGFQHKLFKDMNNGKALVIGGKKGGATSSIFLKNKEAFRKTYEEIIKIPKKWIHVQRNPYDNITTFTKHGHEPDGAIEIYFKQAKAVVAIKDKEDCISVRLEDVIKNTKKEVKRLCKHLEVEVYKKYLDHCREVVWSEPRKTRLNVDWWNDNRIKTVEDNMKKFDFMNGYKFTD